MVSQYFDSYIRHAIEHGRFTLDGDSEAANIAYDCLQNTFKTMVAAGEGDSLFVLYKHIDAWVQLWAASHTLEIDEARALIKLRELEKAEIPHISTGAKYTTQEWKAGELRFLL